MGITQLLMAASKRMLTPEEAIQFIYDNTLSLVALDIDSVQSWIPNGRQYSANQFIQLANWSTPRLNVPFDFSVDSLTGKAANSNYVTVMPIAYGGDEFASNPAGSIKSFSDLNVNLLPSGTITPGLVQSGGAIVNDYGGYAGLFWANTSIDRINNLTVTISSSGEEDRTNWHTYLLPGKWQISQSLARVDATLINSSGGFPVGDTSGVTQCLEWSVTIPANSIMLYMHASKLCMYSVTNLHTYATIPTGVEFADERRSCAVNSAVSTYPGGVPHFLTSMLTNTTPVSQTVTWRVPATVLVSDPAVAAAAMRYGSILVITPYSTFDSASTPGDVIAPGWATWANDTDVAVPTTVSTTFNTDGTVSYVSLDTPGPVASWATTPVAGFGNDYWIRFQFRTGFTPSGSTLDTWLPLSSARTISLAPGSGERFSIIDVQIAADATGVDIITTGTVELLNTDAESGGGGGFEDLPIIDDRDPL